jgi:hypothetical protein
VDFVLRYTLSRRETEGGSIYIAVISYMYIYLFIFWFRLRSWVSGQVVKLNNLEEEVRRIMSKEGGADGLSDGQRRQTVMPWQGNTHDLRRRYQ